ncbi:MAG: AraC family transcriptional regulator [Muribaculaceae bacterium]|nr:AraC family transcriptional regulator [Muribaculaceae bacterium]
MQISNFLMLNVGYAEHKGDWNYRNVNSPFARIYYVVAGSGQIVMGDKRHMLLPGHMYMIPPFTTHTDFCEGHFAHYYLHIYEETSSGEDIISAYDFPFEIKGREIDRELFSILVESNKEMTLKSSDPRTYDDETSLIECVKFNRGRPLYLRMESMGIVSWFIGRFIKDARPKYMVSDERIRTALKMINSMISELVGVEQLSEEARMSTGHFIRLFKEELGCTPMQFIIERKMMRAKMMLVSESLMMKEIAYSLGYEDVSYFTRLFKKHVGITPSQYRQAYNSQTPSISE